jgi:hypothetical protein
MMHWCVGSMLWIRNRYKLSTWASGGYKAGMAKEDWTGCWVYDCECCWLKLGFRVIMTQKL